MTITPPTNTNLTGDSTKRELGRLGSLQTQQTDWGQSSGLTAGLAHQWKALRGQVMESAPAVPCYHSSRNELRAGIWFDNTINPRQS